MKLFCFPYAGGISTIYRGWDNLLVQSIDMVALDFAGRGSRLAEIKYKSFSENISDLYKICDNEIKGQSFAFFGYSMGALIALEMTQQLMKRNAIIPEHIFLAASNIPEITKREFGTDVKNIEEKIISMGGIPDEILKNRKIRNYYMSLIKDDFKIMSQCELTAEVFKIPCDISILYGKDDETTKWADIRKWNQYCLKTCNYYAFEGGHFFINSNIKPIIEIINKVLANTDKL